MQPEMDHVFKIILLGSTSVGKSQILMKFTKGIFHESTQTTVGVEYSAKIINLDTKKIRIQVWDTAGQEKFQAIARAYYKGAVGALLVYDITKPDTFKEIQKWLSEIREYADQANIVCMLIGNKSDLEEDRKVFKDEAIAFAQQMKLGFLETSAKTGYNIDFSFKQIAEEIYRDMNDVKVEDEFSPAKRRNQQASVLKVSDSNKKKKADKDSCC